MTDTAALTYPAYRSIRGINWSTLKHIRPPGGSPKHYLHALTVEPEDTPAFTLGRAAHAALYEPDRFAAEWVVYPGAVRRGAEWEKFRALHDGAEVVLASTLDTALAIAESVRTDPVATRYALHGFREHTIQWRDQLSGLDCKGRVDEVNGRLSDLKTTSSLQWFMRDAERFGYWVQMAWYSDGLAATGYEVEKPPVLIVVENEAPYDVLCYEMTEETLDDGRAEYRKCLDTLQECTRTGTWPGKSGGEAQVYERYRRAGTREQAEVVDLTEAAA